MELESSNLIINMNKPKNGKKEDFFSYQKDVKLLTNFLRIILGFLNVLIISSSSLIFFSKRIDQIIPLKLNYSKTTQKDLIYYQDIQHNFCNNVRYLANKELEEKIILYNVNLNDTNFDMFIYDNFDYYSWKIKLNQSYEGEATLHMLNAIKYFEDKYDFENDDIAIIDIGSNVGWFSIYFGTFKYNVLSFEPLPENYYILKKNFCRSNMDFFGTSSTITIINEALYPIETFCDYYKDIKNSKKNLVLCDKSKEKNLDKDYIKIDTIKTNKLSNFIPLINDKRMTLLRFDLEYEGEMAIESGKELITKYHIPFVFIEFNMLMFALHETRPQDFLRFFTQNGYKISLNGFLTKQFISVEDIMKTNFVTINLYLVYIGE
jgi:FkbM family methyltransferase